MPIDSSMVISGFISKIVNDCVDVLKEKIRDADRNRKANEQNIETRIYQVTIDAINMFTYNDYKKHDILYDVAENILNGFKSGKEYVKAVKMGLEMFGPQVTDDRCKDFLETLCREICRTENSDLYREINMVRQNQMIDCMQEGFKQSSRNDEVINRKLDDVIEKLDSQEVDGTGDYSGTNVKNRAEEYAEKWNKNVFLNDFDEEDENAGVEIKLAEIYKEECLPHYIWKKNKEPSNRLRELLEKYIIDKNEKKMLLILGQAGIGKSTLITWIMANLVKSKEQILVYQFASDLKNINWQSDDIFNEILKTLNLEYADLENRTLILDGFDEIQINGEKERSLRRINQELKKKNYLKKFSLIITCRKNYIEQSDLGNIEYITLQAWNKEQIKSFCEIYDKEITRNNPEAVNSKNLEIKINKILENKEVFGIPLILYMVLALNIDVEKSSSMVDIYDQIFSLERGSIYDRCYDIEHRINSPKIREHIHQVSQK